MSLVRYARARASLYAKLLSDYLECVGRFTPAEKVLFRFLFNYYYYVRKHTKYLSSCFIIVVVSLGVFLFLTESVVRYAGAVHEKTIEYVYSYLELVLLNFNTYLWPRRNLSEILVGFCLLFLYR